MRVNRLSLSLLQLFRRPLADVLREAVMDPIGAVADWAWQPYRNSWVEIDGARHAVGARRLALGRRALDVEPRSRALRAAGAAAGRVGPAPAARTPAGSTRCAAPCPINPQYGCCGGSTPDARSSRARPRSSYAARGAGSNVIWIDPEHDLVAVVRWIDKASFPEFVQLLMESIARA